VIHAAAGYKYGANPERTGTAASSQELPSIRRDPIADHAIVVTGVRLDV
jgi:hypothetical protein